jgi:hypothetical protein
MPKFYVQSGSLQLVTTATDPRAAAIWAVHRTLSSSLPFLNDGELSHAPRATPSQPQLGETIVVSERGFGSTDHQTFETLGVATEWTQLLLAVDRLQKRLAAN